MQAYIAAMPGWKRDLGERLDALIVRNVPNVRKAVKWSNPTIAVGANGAPLNRKSVGGLGICDAGGIRVKKLD